MLCADEVGLAGLLVRRDHEPLQAGRVDGPADRHHEAQAERRHERPEARLHGLIGGERHADRGGDDQHPGGRDPGVHVDVGGAGDQAGRRRQELGDRQPGAGRDDDEPAGREDRQVRRGRRPQLQPALRADPQEAGAEIDEADADRRDRQHQDHQRAQPAPERQLKDVEADVVAEHRIGLAEGRRVPVDEPRLPLGGRDRRHQHRPGRGSERHHRPQAGRVDDDRARSFRRDHDDLAPGQDAEREAEVQQEQPEGDRERRQPQRRLRGQAARVDALVADLPEPQPVGVELHP